MPNPISTWLPLSESRINTQNGELMISLSYLPTAERLTVVVVKARNINLCADDSTIEKDQLFQNIFVKVRLFDFLIKMN